MVDIDPDLKHLLGPYLERRQQDLVILQAALKASDFSTIAMIGHRLRGNAGNLGLDDLGALGAQLENAANAKDITAASAIVDKIKLSLQTLES